MTALFAVLVAGPPVLLMGAGCLPDGWVNRHVAWLRRFMCGLMGLAFGCSVMAAVIFAREGLLDVVFAEWSGSVALNVGVYYDSLTAIMMLLITFIGLVIALFSVRYLDGDARQGRFFRWMLFTLGAVLAMVVSRNLVMFTLAWMSTSWGLHQLLTHYPERSWAIWAARKKFLISRVGDVFLLSAIGLTFACYGSVDYSVLLQSPGQHEHSDWCVTILGALFVLGAMTKSAQFPFHSWLPDTMETPTPVSALMHAGVINAGGFLIIRLSPLVAQSPWALNFLALVGAFTALLGGLVMLTQTSVKRALAYSTIAQMGFMMLQCGLGAFSAALLHIVAHSLYKAHTFLLSGSVVETARRTTKYTPQPTLVRLASNLLLAIITAGVLAWGSLWLWGIDVGAKPGAILLGGILTLALAHLIWQATLMDSWRVTMLGFGTAALVSSVYVAAWLLIDTVFASSVSHHPLGIVDRNFVFALVVLGFGTVFILQSFASKLAHHSSWQALYVHAANGFYLDIPARRLTARVWGEKVPTP